MRQYLFFLIVSIVMIAGGCKKKPDPIVIVPDIEKNHLQRNHIFGCVKYLETETYYVQADSLPLSDTLRLKELTADLTADISAQQYYTSDGFLLQFLKFNHLKDTILRRNYAYDDEAQVQHWEEFDSTGTMITHGNYLYDRNRFLSGEQIFQGDSMVISFTHTTDGIGNIIRTVQSFSGLQTKTENKFNEQGLVTEITEYEPEGKVFKTAKIEYDNYGDEVNRCVYKAGNQMIEYTYTEYAQDGRVRKVIYEDKLHHVKEFHYFFDYDSHKNWQTEVCAVDNQIVYIKRRTFEYYE